MLRPNITKLRQCEIQKNKQLLVQQTYNIKINNSKVYLVTYQSATHSSATVSFLKYLFLKINKKFQALTKG